VRAALSASNRADLIGRVVVDDGLLGNHVPAQQRLRHRIDLVVVGTVWEGAAFLDEIVHPRHELRVGQIGRDLRIE
jgi:hypothetical protein